MQAINILSKTPVWVWFLLAFLIFRGVKSLQAGTRTLPKLAIVPVVFAVWGLYSAITQSYAGNLPVLFWVVGVAVGVPLGLLLAHRSGLSADPRHKTITVPGSVVPLLLMLVTFFAKFWIGVEVVTTSPTSDATYIVLGALVSGTVAGIFAGRLAIYAYAIFIPQS